ncbi:MAG: hypothetical protein HFH31_03160 [Bacilli bacterium]|nr:hypothetical protein [Bacilli bacterium]
MSSIKKYQKGIKVTLLILSLPLVVPFVGSCIDILLKAGRIVGTVIRVY